MSRPICEWTFDPEGNLTIKISADNLGLFRNWLNDENSKCEQEMYDLMDALKEKKVE